MTSCVEFNGVNYVVEPGVGVVRGAVLPSELSGPEQVEVYNLLASNIGGQVVKKFSDRRAGARRIVAKLKEFQAIVDDEAKDQVQPEPKTKAKKSKPKKKAKAEKTTKQRQRGMRFVYPFNGHDELRSIKSKDSLRGRVAKVLEKGASFAMVVEIVKEFDAARGHGPGNEERRAYEVIRLLHHYVGYGLRQDEKGKIFIHTGES